ncbi:MAG: FtsK/SpoIIIE domain-containing protein [Streptosporangiaceae bacterium]
MTAVLTGTPALVTAPAAVPVFPLSIFSPVHLGVDEYGDQVRVDLAERNLLIGGEPGGGKSSALNLITAHGALSADCRLVLVDGNQVQLGPWRHSADMFIGPSLTDAIDAFTEFQQIMNRRYQRLLAAGLRKITRGMDEPVYLVVIDEYAYYSATIGKKTDREAFAALARDLIARGRAAGVILVLATQRPSHQIIDPSMRDLFSYRLAFRCTTDSSSDVVLGQGWASAGYSAATIDPSHAASPGCCPRPASPAGSRPPGCPTTTSTTWPPTPPSSAERPPPHDHCHARSGQEHVNTRLTPKRLRPVVENDDYAAFLRRVLAAYARRIAGGDIESLTLLVSLAADIETAACQAVTGLRDQHSYSWADIGHRLGITRQAAQQRWGAQP